MDKTTQKAKLGPCLMIAIFALTALASSSSKSTLDTIDRGTESYQSLRGIWSSTAGDSIEQSVDSIHTDMPLVAFDK